nr:hypothetical protein GCM10020093_096740 [Planobispora longispora]
MQIPNTYVTASKPGGHRCIVCSSPHSPRSRWRGARRGGGEAERTELAELTARSGGSGPFTLVIGRDTTAYLQPLLDRWNRDHPAEQVTLLELPEAADEQRAQMVANLQAKSDRYDVLGLDVVWTAEFADAGWIVPLDRSLFPLDRFLQPAVSTAVYRGKLWAVPYTSNAGLLYYRKDLLAKEGFAPPTTWAQLREQARTLHEGYGIGGYAGQFLAYEGLTVNVAEAVQSAGAGPILSRDGTQVTMDPARAEAGLDFLMDGFREGGSRPSRSPSRRRSRGWPSRRAAWPSPGTGRTPTARPPSRTSARSSPSPGFPASTGRAPARWAGRTSRSAPTPSGRSRRWSSSATSPAWRTSGGCSPRARSHPCGPSCTTTPP